MLRIRPVEWILIASMMGMGAAMFLPPVQTDCRAHRPTAEAVQERLFGSWYEDTTVVAGVPWPEHRVEPLGWKFGPDAVVSWQITGELGTHTFAGGPGIDVSGATWELNILSREVDGKIWVLPTIFKFEGEDFVWATPFPGEGWQEENADGRYAGRPTSFTSTKENRQFLRRLKRCEYLQTQFRAPTESSQSQP